MEEELGPVLRAGPGEPPYPEMMNGAAIAEIEALDPDIVRVKGDLTHLGTEEEYAAFLAAYGQLGARMRHVRGNHDAMLDASMALEGAVHDRRRRATLAVLDTVSRASSEADHTEQLHWSYDLSVGHGTGDRVRPPSPLNLELERAAVLRDQPRGQRGVRAIVVRHENIVGYFAGHTHRNRIRRTDRARRVPSSR
jgi:predicted phosphodiesterase